MNEYEWKKMFYLINKKKSIKFSHKILLIFSLIFILLIIYINTNEYINLNSNIALKYIRKAQRIVFEKIIEKKFKKENHVNLNEIESKLLFGRKFEILKSYRNEINVGLSLDKDYIFKTMITAASVMDSQKLTTRLRLHFSVVKEFKPKDMIIIYSLRERIREDVEFNFYNASRVERELSSITYKGPGLTAKLLLPQLVLDDVKRLIIIDSGDLLVLRDLSQMYNWNMNNNIYMGSPDFSAGVFGKISNKTLDIYINA